MTRPAPLIAPLAAATVLALALAGCASEPLSDSRFGDAVRQLRLQQQIDPQAAQRHGSAQGPFEGRMAREARDRYLETFAAPPAVSVINIGVGAGGPSTK